MESLGQLRKTLHWRFQEEQGIFIPSELEFKRYRRSDDEEPILIIHRHFTLKDVRINEPLYPTVFEIGHLGIQYGDRMADRIENWMMVFDGEQFVHAEEFTLQPDLLPGESDS